MGLWCHISLVVWIIIIASTDKCAEAKQKYKEQFAIEGTSYKMKCPDLGNNESFPMPYIVWSVNGLPPRGQKYKLLDDGLVIRNVSKEDTIANYTCTALDRQTFLPVNSERVKLVIRQRGAKSFEKSSSSIASTENKVKIWVWGIVNQWKTLQCRMFSRPSPTFTWRNQKTGEEIKTTPDLYKIVHDDVTSNLTIFLHNDTLFGEYHCIASNIHGESTQNFILAEGYLPKSPFMYPTFIGRDKITVKVQPQDDNRRSGSDLTDEILPIKHYFVQFVKADNLKSVDQSESADNPNSKHGGEYRRKWTILSKTIEVKEHSPHITTETFELKNLQENATYLVRAAVANAAAISDFSTAIRITTDSPLPKRAFAVDNETEDEKLKSHAGREEYGRSADGDDVIIKGTTESSATISNKDDDGSSIGDGECSNPKFRKTVITTITSTTLIETIDANAENAPGNSSLVKKRVEEDTTIDRVNLCSFN